MFGLLGTANVQIFVRGTIIDRIVVVVPSRLPHRESQRAEGGMWTEGRLAVEGGELGNGVRRCRSGPGVSRGIGIGGPSWCCRGVRRCTICCRRARPPTQTSATESRPGGGRAGGHPDRQADGPAAGSGAWTSLGWSSMLGWSSIHCVLLLITSRARRICRSSR